MLHMSAPDHWVTLIVLGRVSKWNRSRLIEVGAMTAAGHVAVSVLLGFAIVGLGLFFSELVSIYVAVGVGVIMVAGGLAYGFRELFSADHHDYEQEVRGKLTEGETHGMRFRYFAVLGAALSPDLSILPIFLLAVPLGVGFAFDAAVVFATASVLALLTLLILGQAGLARALEVVPPKYNDALVGFVIASVGAYIVLVG